MGLCTLFRTLVLVLLDPPTVVGKESIGMGQAHPAMNIASCWEREPKVGLWIRVTAASD